jgi:hypothetical protein
MGAQRLAQRIEGILAESSHAKWPEADLRDAILQAIEPFLESAPLTIQAERVTV